MLYLTKFSRLNLVSYFDMFKRILLRFYKLTYETKVFAKDITITMTMNQTVCITWSNMSNISHSKP
jgi:hypothetical protein